MLKHLFLTVTFLFLSQFSYSQSELIDKLSITACECIEKNGTSKEAVAQCVEKAFSDDKEAIKAELDIENTEEGEKKLALLVLSKILQECPSVLELSVDQSINRKMDASTAYKKGKEAYENDNVDEAINLFTNAIRLDEKAEYRNERGNAYFTQGNYYKAIADYLRAIELYDQYYVYYYNVAYALYQLEDMEEALVYLEKSLELDDTDCDTKNLYGLINNAYQDYEASIDAFKAAAACSPENASYAYNLGYTYYDLQKYDSSAMWFMKAKEFGYDSPDIYNNLGNAYFNAGDFKKSIKYHKLHLDESEDNYIPYYNLATCYFGLEDYKKTLQYLDKALELEKEDQDIYDYYTLTYLELEEYDKALENANKALSYSPDFASYYDNRAQAYEGLGKYQEAIEDLKVSNSLYKDDCWVFESLERLYDKTEQAKELAQTQEKLKSLECEEEG